MYSMGKFEKVTQKAERGARLVKEDGMPEAARYFRDIAAEFRKAV